MTHAQSKMHTNLFNNKFSNSSSSSNNNSNNNNNNNNNIIIIIHNNNNKDWQKKAAVVPVVIEALGAIPRDLVKHLKTLGLDKISPSQL